MDILKYIIVSFFIFSIACKVNEDSLKSNTPLFSIKAYYFPIEKLDEPLVYVYEEPKSKEQLIWELSSEAGHGDTLFTTISYYKDSLALKVIEEVYESIGKKGATIIRYRVNKQNVWGEPELIESEIKENIAYKWYQRIGGKITWISIANLQLEYEIQETTKRTRELKGVDAEIVFNDKKHKAITFHDSFEIIYSSPSYQDTLRFEQKSTYAEGIGMYGYERVFDDGDKVNYFLKDIYTKDKWIKVLNARKI